MVPRASPVARDTAASPPQPAARTSAAANRRAPAHPAGPGSPRTALVSHAHQSSGRIMVRCLIIVAAAIVAFPYLPGSDSPAFKGISVFLGVLLSLGSTSAVAHGVAGTILTYMRAFQVGDFVRIGNDVGEVVEKTLLVTRICTQKREVVTIPNGTVLGGVVVNYSAEAKQKGVIFHTTVTIGYSAPWRKVHELLLAAALVTDDVLHDPAAVCPANGAERFLRCLRAKCLHRQTERDATHVLGVAPEHSGQVQRSWSRNKFTALPMSARRQSGHYSRELLAQRL